MAVQKKQSSAEAYNALLKELQSGKIAPVYLLMGGESYYIDKICDWMTSNLLKEEEKDFNLSIVYGNDISAQQIMDNARRFPMMAERQVIVVRDTQNMKDLDLLEKYMDHPVPTTVLVLCHGGGTLDARKKANARIIQASRVFISDPPKYDSEIIAFINSYIKQPEYNATIDQRAAQVMAAHIGGDLKRLSSELDKLLLSFAPGAPRKITSDIIEQQIGISKDYNVFELKDAIVRKDALKAHRIAKYYNDNPKAGGLFKVLPMMFNLFQNLMLCYYIPKPITESAIMAQLGLKNTWATKDYITAKQNYSARKTLGIISKLREIDARSKGVNNNTTTTPASELLKELISFILL